MRDYNHTSRYNRYSKSINKNGTYRPGSSSNMYIRDNKTSPESQDTVNRRNVISKIEEGLKTDKTLEEITTILASDEEIKKQFDYLTKAGIDLKTVFQNWYNSLKKRKMYDKGREK